MKHAYNRHEKSAKRPTPTILDGFASPSGSADESSLQNTAMSTAVRTMMNHRYHAARKKHTKKTDIPMPQAEARTPTIQQDDCIMYDSDQASASNDGVSNVGSQSDRESCEDVRTPQPDRAPPKPPAATPFFTAARQGSHTSASMPGGIPSMRQDPVFGADSYKTTEGGVGVEVYPDADTSLDPETLNMIASKIAGVRTSFVPCMLPEDEEDARELEAIRSEAEGAGEVDDGHCPMCTVGDDGLTGDASEIVNNIATMDSALFGSVSDSRLRKMKVDVYNKYVYAPAMRLRRVGIEKWTVFKMHLHETRCNKKNFERHIMENIKSIKRHKNFLTSNVIFTKASVGGCVSDRITYDYKGSLHWLQLCKEEVNQITALKKLQVGPGACGKGNGKSGTQNTTQKGNSYGALKDAGDSIYFPNK